MYAAWPPPLTSRLACSPGELVSSSNEIVDEPGHPMEVTVETSHDVIWTTVLRPEGWSQRSSTYDTLDDTCES